MKIIRPTDLTKPGVFQSDAPDDGYAQWQTVGRDFLSTIDELVITCNQATVYAVDSSPSFIKELYAFDLDTGSQVSLPFTLSNFDIRSMAASPDGQYLAIGGFKNGSYNTAVVRVYNLANGSQLFERQARPADEISWSQDSSMLAFMGYSTAAPKYNMSVLVVAAGVWGTVGVIDNVDSMYLDSWPPDVGAYSWGYTFVGLVAGPSGVYYSLETQQSYVPDDPITAPRYRIRKSIVGLLTPSGNNTYATRATLGPTTSWTELNSPRYLFHNQAKGHVLGYLDGDFYAFDESTFAEDADVPSMSGITLQSISPALNGGEFIATNSSVQPYVRKFDAATYSQTASLDAETGGFTSNIRYSADYIVFGAPGGGYGLIDKATGSRVTEVNPTVTEGDIYTYGQHNYRALSDNNERPDLGAKASPATWLDLGFINPLRMTDGKVGSFTESSSPLVIEISSDELVDGVAMFGVEADSVRVELLTDQALLFDSGVQSLRDSSMINGWYAHFFARRGVKRDYVFTSLPPYRGATLRITLTSAEAAVRIGELVAGQVIRLGDLLFGSKFGIEDWSDKVRNVFGHWEVVERGYSKRAVYQVSARTNQLSWIQQLLAGLRSTAVVYIGSESQQLSIIYGFFVILDLVVEKPVYSQCRIEVEGLTDDSATN